MADRASWDRAAADPTSRVRSVGDPTSWGRFPPGNAFCPCVAPVWRPPPLRRQAGLPSDVPRSPPRLPRRPLWRPSRPPRVPSPRPVRPDRSPVAIARPRMPSISAPGSLVPPSGPLVPSRASESCTPWSRTTRNRPPPAARGPVDRPPDAPRDPADRPPPASRGPAGRPPTCLPWAPPSAARASRPSAPADASPAPRPFAVRGAAPRPAVPRGGGTRRSRPPGAGGRTRSSLVMSAIKVSCSSWLVESVVVVARTDDLPPPSTQGKGQIKISESNTVSIELPYDVVHHVTDDFEEDSNNCLKLIFIGGTVAVCDMKTTDRKVGR